jgi:hypothetical protein
VRGIWGNRRVELNAIILRNAEDFVKKKQMLKRNSGRYCEIVNWLGPSSGGNFLLVDIS